jgi:hypothetical protein
LVPSTIAVNVVLSGNGSPPMSSVKSGVRVSPLTVLQTPGELSRRIQVAADAVDRREIGVVEGVGARHVGERRLVRLPRAERAVRDDEPGRNRVRELGVKPCRAIECRGGQQDAMDLENAGRPARLAHANLEHGVVGRQPIDDHGRWPAELPFQTRPLRELELLHPVGTVVIVVVARRDGDVQPDEADRCDMDGLAQQCRDGHFGRETVDGDERCSLRVLAVSQYEPMRRDPDNRAQRDVHVAELDIAVEVLGEDGDDALTDPRLLPAVDEDAGDGAGDGQRRHDRDQENSSVSPHPHPVARGRDASLDSLTCRSRMQYRCRRKART